MPTMNRRKFLSLGAKTLTGAGLALGASPWHTLAQAATGSFDTASYRALVCVYLDGGMDGFSMLVPVDTAGYAEYARSRTNLAVPQNQLTPLNTLNTAMAPVGLSSTLQGLLPLYDEGRLGFISNVGTLIEPTTKEQYVDQSVALPAQLFSHSDQSIQWQQLQGQLTGRDGWGARAAQYLDQWQERDYLTSITLSGSNYWQSGSQRRPYSMSEEGVAQYAGMDKDDSDWQRPRREAFRRLLEKSHSHVFTQAYADLQSRAAGITEELGAAIDSAAPSTIAVPADNELAAKLAMVARVINARETLGMSRQIFYVDMKGWDVHDGQARDQPGLFTQLNDALVYFQQVIDEMQLGEQVTAFTASDFGRTLTSNGDGTDHGWGNHHLVMGGAVNGGDVYGALPRMSIDGPDSVRTGRVVPGLSASQYASTLLSWIGLDQTQVHEVLPDLNNFAAHDLGFLKT